ncbi:MAG: hypothetical protein JWQ91_2221 [Aeromicrobium sp.]|uniref:VanW family protein n=1 Tax=Aeromicrobium sp. TaxID=1871063 RepID=UPI00261C197E|nr:VanW family protein [Aeromicrobium sp.]MCW2788208.1 hypothetical protein [Aeromicrobium sp.]MCW2825304.1 hypothetical protein [Aeromicrobium sp.]
MSDVRGRPGDEPRPDDEPAGEDEALTEAGVVVEDDELDLEEETPVEGDEPPEPVAEVPEDSFLAGVFAGRTDDEAYGEEPPAGPPPVEDSPRHRGRLVLLGLLLVLGALYLAGHVLTGTRMPAQATIGGVDVGGKSPAEARQAVDAALSPREDREIVLVRGKKEFRVSPQSVGLALDVDRSVEQAGGGRSWDPRDMIGLFVGEHDHDPALDVDDAKLQSAIGTIGESVNRDVVEAQITFRKTRPVAREPEPGLVVSRSATADAIQQAYLVDDQPIRVPTVPVEPVVDSEGLAEAMRTVARPAVSGPIRLEVGDKRISLPVTAYAAALVIRVESGRLVPHLDAKKLAEPLIDSTTGIGRKAVDATVRITNGKPVVVPGKKGVGLQPREMAKKLIPALTEKGPKRAVAVEAKVVEPGFTTKDARALRITEKISGFTTEFPYAEYRNTNQGRAADLINGTIIKPGETFSFNSVVGERTEANGFVTGTVINGGVFREELGGGVSQVATTMYNAGFFGGMDDTEHHPHAFYINRYPVGREATVYFGSLDLRWKNPTKYGVLVRSYVKRSTPSSAGEMHVELWSTKVWDRIDAGKSARRNDRKPGTQYDSTDRCVAQAPVAGFDIDIYRTFFRGGKKARSETDTATYQAADKVICDKDPKDD